jgi:hypothetical protein
MVQTERRNSAKKWRATVLLFLNHAPPTFSCVTQVRLASPKIILRDLITTAENRVMRILQISSLVFIHIVAAR